MSFLIGLVAQLLEWFLTKIGAEALVLWKKHEQDIGLQVEAKSDAAAIQDAKTPEQQSDALQKTIDHTFGPDSK